MYACILYMYVCMRFNYSDTVFAALFFEQLMSYEFQKR